MFLTSQPQLTLFRQVFRRYSPFALQAIPQAWSNDAGWGKQSVSIIGRQGDILLDCFLEIDLPSLATYSKDGFGLMWANNVGYKIFEYMDVLIGGTRVERVYGDFMEMWDQLSMAEEKRPGLNSMLGRFDSWNKTPDPLKINNLGSASAKIYVPLQFFFSRGKSQLGVNLLGLQFHDLRIVVQWRGLADVTKRCSVPILTAGVTATTTVPDFTSTLVSTFGYLDTPERKRFSSQPIEMLLTLTQMLSFPVDNAGTKKLDITAFAHPVRELIFAYQTYSATNGGQDQFSDRLNFAYADPAAGEFLPPVGDFYTSARLLCNGHQRDLEAPPMYWHTLVPYRTHTRTPIKPISVMCFSLDPENDLSPNGSLNFSRYAAFRSSLFLSRYSGLDLTRPPLFLPTFAGWTRAPFTSP